MAEYLLIEKNTTNIPLIILRPSIIGASFEEPVPGWTDSVGMTSGTFMLAGLGILKEIPGNMNNIGD
mgnify:CR=1 FL=1